jgi:hypothetical protein
LRRLLKEGGVNGQLRAPQDGLKRLLLRKHRAHTITVAGDVAILEAAGFIKVDRRPGPGNFYTLLPVQGDWPKVQAAIAEMLEGRERRRREQQEARQQREREETAKRAQEREEREEREYFARLAKNQAQRQQTQQTQQRPQPEPQQQPHPSPIPTTYQGYRFRSRLEARWAVAFDHLGFKWSYEPGGYDLGDGVWYLPDFSIDRVDDADSTWFEIKGNRRPDEGTLTKCRKLAQHTKQIVVLYAGNIGDHLTWEWDSDGTLVIDGKENHWPFASTFSKSARKGQEHAAWKEALQQARSARWEHGESPEQRQQPSPLIVPTQQPSPTKTLYCSFCGRSQHEVRKLICGPVDHFICDECTELCGEIIRESDKPNGGTTVPIRQPEQNGPDAHPSRTIIPAQPGWSVICGDNERSIIAWEISKGECLACPIIPTLQGDLPRGCVLKRPDGKYEDNDGVQDNIGGTDD